MGLSRDDEHEVSVQSAPRLTLTALPGIPRVFAGDDVPRLIAVALAAGGLALVPGDVLVVTSKILSRADDRFVDLAAIAPRARASKIAETTGQDPRLIELVLRESRAVSRVARGVLIVRHRLGFVLANSGIDLSNAEPRKRSSRPTREN